MQRKRSLVGSNFVGLSRLFLTKRLGKFDLKTAHEFLKQLRAFAEHATILQKIPGVLNRKANFVSMKMGKQNVDVEMVTSSANPYAYVLWIHGGAYVMNNAKFYRTVTSNIATQADVTCFVPNYRLAPEHPFPAAIDDVVAVYEHLLNEIKIPPHKLCIGGDSAGGGIALTLLDRIRQLSLPKPQALILNSPWVDLRWRGESWENNVDLARGSDCDLFISWCAKSYAGDVNMRDPRLSPYFLPQKNLEEMLPYYVLLQGGDDELLTDSIEKFHKKLDKVHGIRYWYELLEGGWHVPLFATHAYEGKEQFRQIKTFVEKAF